MSVAHDSDFYGWTREQAAILRAAEAARLNGPRGIDWAHLAEEIESLGISQERELLSRYRVLLTHLLKWRFQPAKRSRSWQATMAEQRDEIESLLRKSPGLRPKRAAELDASYPQARRRAALETRLPLQTFPTDCPFTLDQVEDQEFWPDAAGPDA